jgi:hypothetical protein
VHTSSAQQWQTLLRNALVRPIQQCPYTFCEQILFVLASQNEAAIRNLRLGLAIPTILHILLRLLFRRSSLPPSKTSLALYVLTFFPTFFLGRYLEKIGTVKRDAAGGLISSGEDLSQPGLTEYCFDVLYITCMLPSFVCVVLFQCFPGACQVGSGVFGDKFWYLYLIVRTIQYALFHHFRAILTYL